MPHTWQLQEAKNKLSEVVEAALHDGPQIITRRGAKTAVVLAYDDYRHMLANRQPLTAFLRASPLAETPLDLTRSTADTGVRLVNSWDA